MKTRPISKRIREIEKLLTEIPGEPCGGTILDCKNPRHSEWHNLLNEKIDLERYLFNLWYNRLWRNWGEQLAIFLMGTTFGALLAMYLIKR